MKYCISVKMKFNVMFMLDGIVLRPYLCSGEVLFSAKCLKPNMMVCEHESLAVFKSGVEAEWDGALFLSHKSRAEHRSVLACSVIETPANPTPEMLAVKLYLLADGISEHWDRANGLKLEWASFTVNHVTATYYGETTK